MVIINDKNPNNLDKTKNKNTNSNPIQNKNRIIIKRRPSYRSFDNEINEYRCSLCSDEKKQCDTCYFETKNFFCKN